MNRLAMVLIAAAMLFGCDSDDTDFDDTGSGSGSGSNPTPQTTLEWRATLSPTDIYNPLRGDAVVRQNVGELAFGASVSLRNDVAGAVRPWHVHVGNCAAHGAIVGNDLDYPRLILGSAGAATSDALIRVGLDATAAYSVNIHQSDAQFTTIIACGELILQ